MRSIRLLLEWHGMAWHCISVYLGACLLVYCPHGKEHVQKNMRKCPSIKVCGEHLVKDDEDAGVLRVVVDQSPVEFSFRIILPAVLLIKNLQYKIKKYHAIAHKRPGENIDVLSPSFPIPRPYLLYGIRHPLLVNKNYRRDGSTCPYPSYGYQDSPPDVVHAQHAHAGHHARHLDSQHNHHVTDCSSHQLPGGLIGPLECG